MSHKRGDTPSHQEVEGGASAIKCERSFEGGRATLSDIAAFLAEVSCGMSEEEAKRKDQALPEAYRAEAAYLNGVLTSLRQGHSQMLPNQLKFDTTVKSFTRYLIHKAECEMWPIEGEGGAPQSPPQRYGYLFVETVIDHYTKARGSQHAKFVEALRTAATAAVIGSQQTESVQADTSNGAGEDDFVAIRSLKTSEIAEAFSFHSKLHKALSDTNNHQWLLPARVFKGGRRVSHRWCPLKLANALISRDGNVSSDLDRAFFREELLRPWLQAWQESRRDRNAFGQ